MSKVICEREDIVAIADAVRNKTGNSDEMTLGEIASGINGIEAGGSGGGSVETCTVTLIINPSPYTEEGIKGDVCYTYMNSDGSIINFSDYIIPTTRQITLTNIMPNSYLILNSSPGVYSVETDSDSGDVYLLSEDSGTLVIDISECYNGNITITMTARS